VIHAKASSSRKTDTAHQLRRGKGKKFGFLSFPLLSFFLFLFLLSVGGKTTDPRVHIDSQLGLHDERHNQPDAGDKRQTTWRETKDEGEKSHTFFPPFLGFTSIS
jgi:hypothetical protein